ncbi:YggS family pyridoxal phosphate-dependent enzyme [Acetohalobium arabaticum]|uniref:Pyridoxal phosphate homeostasis protein n=1 Tax=Acetohalobium arabaticum (strain ATCC 49924 / DSM 5501 / Z-7288) TaxID=574087 RepID=D9QPG9_ACEAZ|nr:YggS family pyridoxal phosphate-dependent enzyme [Acetohalobium arabaticum]ADL12410.1 alanine racemase domain protein [Acetohalobium arabaticum DSM 5501]
MSEIKDNLKQVQKRIAAAAKRAGRDSDEIKLVAVTKTRGIEEIKEVIEADVVDLGESRVQELRDKYDNISQKINWHMIGHLQRNKVKYIMRMERCNLIHSMDSMRLAKKINKRAGMADRVMNVLVQINVAGDENKFGLEPEETIDYLRKVAEFENLQVKGLMTMVPYVDDTEQVRPYFRELKELFEEVKRAEIPNIEMQELSMGITNDFEVAIEEGATIVRVGSAIFGPREY